MVKPESQPSSALLYERLIRSIEQALEQLDDNKKTQEVTVRDLTQGQLALISAYRSKDVSWLRGWHAALEEVRVHPEQIKTPLSQAVSNAPSISVCCALCGANVRLSAGEPLPACEACGARIYRAPPSY